MGEAEHPHMARHNPHMESLLSRKTLKKINKNELSKRGGKKR
jgi:hypothetical protein